VIVTMAHVRSVPGFGRRKGFCARGARAFCMRHGLDWTAFLREGIEAERLLATGDAMALAVVEHAQREEVIRGRQ